jgi:hypothetical protein
VPEATPGAGLGCALALGAANHARPPPDVAAAPTLLARCARHQPDAGPGARRLREFLNDTTRWPERRLAGLRAGPQLPADVRGMLPTMPPSPASASARSTAHRAAAFAAGGPATKSRPEGVSTRPAAPTSGALLPACLDGLGLGFQLLPLAGPALSSPGHSIPSGLALQRVRLWRRSTERRRASSNHSPLLRTTGAPPGEEARSRCHG